MFRLSWIGKAIERQHGAAAPGELSTADWKAVSGGMAIAGAATTSAGANGGAGKVNVQDLPIGINADKASPKLLQSAVDGKVFTTVEIHGTATYGDAGEFCR